MLRSTCSSAIGLIILLVAGCSDSSAVQYRFDGTGPPPNQDLTHDHLSVVSLSGITVVDSAGAFYPRALLVADEYLLILERYPPPAVHVVRIGTYTYEGVIGGQGAGPGEFALPWQFTLALNGQPWVYDHELRRLTRLAWYPGAAPDTQVVSLDASVPPIFRVAWLTDTTIVASGWFERSRFGLIGSGGELVAEIGEPPARHAAMPVRHRNHYYDGWITVRPGGTRFVIATRTAGRIEIYDGHGGFVGTAQTPFDFESAFTAYPVGHTLQYGNDRRIGYIDVVATADRFYGLFSGRSHLRYRDLTDYGHYIHEFDWTGALTRVFRLDEPAFKITIADNGPDELTIYSAHHDPMPAIRRYTIPRP